MTDHENCQLLCLGRCRNRGGLVAATGPASATSAVGIEAMTMSQATIDGIDYIGTQITVAPGGSTGWHYHDGQVFGVIRQGTLTHNAADCSVDGIYPASAPITEPSGPDHVHIGRNLGQEPVVMWVVYIKPAGTPSAMGMPDPGCGYS